MQNLNNNAKSWIILANLSFVFNFPNISFTSFHFKHGSTSPFPFNILVSALDIQLHSNAKISNRLLFLKMVWFLNCVFMYIDLGYLIDRMRDGSKNAIIVAAIVLMNMYYLVQIFVRFVGF